MIGQTQRTRAIWRLLGQFSVFLSVTWLLASLLVNARVSLRPGVMVAGEESPALFLMTSTASLIAVVLSVWLVGRHLDRRSLADFGFRLTGGWWLDFCFGLLSGALLMAGVFLVEWGLGWVSITGFLVSSGTAMPFVPALLVPLLAFGCVGVWEELLFRGYQLTNIAEGLNYPALGPRGAVLAAWVLSSLLFGLVHAGNDHSTLAGVANLTLAGLTFGLGYVLTGQLAIPISLHISWDFFESAVFGLPVAGNDPIGATSVIGVEQDGPSLWTGGLFGPQGGLIFVGAMVVGAFFVALWVRGRRGRLAIHVPLAEEPERYLEAGVGTTPAHKT